ncbi:MAG: hypothetical protein GAK34_02704 [Delftia tsuruhatensis]|nr:MAG: hypothetical protein GAK34_02704 [Delftia tsuruhatensis]
MCSPMAAAIMASCWGVLKTQNFLASTGSTILAEAASVIMGVLASETTSTMASELGVMLEPRITSTLLSLISLRVLATAAVVSEASSRMM